MNKKVPRFCPKCGSKEIHTETGSDITRSFKNGVKIKEIKTPLPRRVFCDGCGYDFLELKEGDKQFQKKKATE